MEYNILPLDNRQQQIFFFSLSLSMTVCVPAGNENGGSPVVVRLSFLIAPKSFCTLPIVQQQPGPPGLAFMELGIV
jgi:hypothetical protein